MTKFSRNLLGAGILILAFMGMAMAIDAKQGACGKNGSCEKGGCGWGRGEGMMALRMLHAIPDLTSEQKTQLKSLEKKVKEEMSPLREKIKTLKMELMTLIGQEAEEAVVNAKVKEISTVQETMMMTLVGYRADLSKILTASQKEFLKNRTQHCQERCGKAKVK